MSSDWQYSLQWGYSALFGSTVEHDILGSLQIINPLESHLCLHDGLVDDLSHLDL